MVRLASSSLANSSSAACEVGVTFSERHRAAVLGLLVRIHGHMASQMENVMG
jgi:hypothetical protein